MADNAEWRHFRGFTYNIIAGGVDRDVYTYGIARIDFILVKGGTATTLASAFILPDIYWKHFQGTLDGTDPSASPGDILQVRITLISVIFANRVGIRYGTGESWPEYCSFVEVGKGITASADLVVTSLTAPSTAAAGATINISDTTVNSGAASASESKTGFYLSTNTTLEPAVDTLLGARSVPALAGAASSTGTTPVIIPPGTPTGTYYIIAKADYESAVSETSETNNTRTASISVF